jgi:hypothetical protein
MDISIYQGGELFFMTMMEDGSPAFVQFEDKCEKIPAYDKDENLYEAYTSWWRLTFPKPRGPKGEQIQENYVQVDKFQAETAKIGTKLYRLQCDKSALESMGVDTEFGLIPATDEQKQEMRAIQHASFLKERPMSDEKKHEGLPVAGYKPQNAAAVSAVNANKEIEEKVLRMLDELRVNPILSVDQRWLALGRTLIEEGFMAINRAIFKPGRAALPGDSE